MNAALLQATGIGLTAVGLVAVLLAGIFLASAVRVVKEYERGVIFRLGRVQGGPKGPGLFLLIPFIDRMEKVDLRTVTMDVPPQDVITRDNVPARVNAVVYFKNEHITGGRWPGKEARNERLLESAEVMRALFAGETVSRSGHVRVDRAKLYSLPEEPPIIGAAVTPETARWVGSWADGLVTINQPEETLAEVLEAFREGGGEGKPIRLQVHLSYHPDEREALTTAHDQWRYAIMGGDVGWDLEMPEDFEQVAAYVRREDVRRHVLVSPDLGQHAEWLGQFADMGFEEIFLHHVGKEQEPFSEGPDEGLLLSLKGVAS